MKNTHLPALTSLRFFAALMVFLSHMGYLGRYKASGVDPDYYSRWYDNWFFEGYAGVTFFFILSGFILAYSYQSLMAAKTVSTKDFLVFRIARIYPLHWFTLAMAAYYVSPTVDTTVLMDAARFISNALLLQAFSTDVAVVKSFNPVAWSLSNEVLFYALFPWLIQRRSRVLLALLVIAVVIKWRWLPAPTSPAWFDILPAAQHPKYYAYFCPYFRLGDFIAGILLYRCWRRTPLLPVLQVTLLQGFSMLLLAGFLFFHNRVHLLYRYDLYYALPMALVVYSFAFQQGLLARLLDKPLLILLGKISFAFYMVHQLLIVYTTPALMAHVPALQALYLEPVFYVLINLVIGLVVSWLLYRFLELPAHRFISHGLLPGKTGVNSPSTPSSSR